MNEERPTSRDSGGVQERPSVPRAERRERRRSGGGLDLDEQDLPAPDGDDVGDPEGRRSPECDPGVVVLPEEADEIAFALMAST